MKPIAVNKERCNVCGLCVEECGRGGITLEDGRILISGTRCMECGHCVAICPNGALETAQGLPSEIIPTLLPPPEMVANFLRARRSQRRYETREVEREIVERLIDLARYAPSGKNEQPFHFVVLQSPEARRSFTQAAFERMQRAKRKLHNPLWRFVVGLLFDPRVRDVRIRRSLDRALRQRETGMDPLFFDAPVILFIHAPAIGATPKDDCCYALFHAVLLAESLGLGSCINGNAEVLIRHFPDLLGLLGIPPDHRVYACATFGYPKHRFQRFVHRREAVVKWL
ncbi:MAG: nitroreductase family protein [Candidatus Sumerlaeota bacterium]|nr:nitroreductase family protein [Candidatus Sumerlaeota bacterium]